MGLVPLEWEVIEGLKQGENVLRFVYSKAHTGYGGGRIEGGRRALGRRHQLGSPAAVSGPISVLCVHSYFLLLPFHFRRKEVSSFVLPTSTYAPELGDLGPSLPVISSWTHFLF